MMGTLDGEPTCVAGRTVVEAPEITVHVHSSVWMKKKDIVFFLWMNGHEMLMDLVFST